MPLIPKTFPLFYIEITPVVLITSSEGCSVQTKAIIASSLEPKDVVHHLIIYRQDPNSKNFNDGEDDSADGDGQYDPSFDDDADVKVNLSVLYVSYSDGIGMLLFLDFCIDGFFLICHYSYISL